MDGRWLDENGRLAITLAHDTDAIAALDDALGTDPWFDDTGGDGLLERVQYEFAAFSLYSLIPFLALHEAAHAAMALLLDVDIEAVLLAANRDATLGTVRYTDIQSESQLVQNLVAGAPFLFFGLPVFIIVAVAGVPSTPLGLFVLLGLLVTGLPDQLLYSE